MNRIASIMAMGSLAVPPFDPSTISGLRLWLKADSLALSDGAGVSTWTDSSGTGINVNGLGGAANPIYKTAIVNGKPVVRFSAASSQLLYVDGTSSMPGATTDYTIFIVAKLTSTSAARAFFTSGQTPGEGGGTAILFQTETSDWARYHFDTGYVRSGETSGVTTGVWALLTADWNGTSIHLWRNGTLKDTVGTTVIGNTGSRTTVGCNIAGANYWDGDIAEVLVYTAVLGSTDRGNVGGYIGDKYGITVASGSSLLTGLVAYYPLSDLTDSAGGTSLTDHGTVTFGTGKVGNCATFVSASSQWLSHADVAAYHFGTGEFSFSYWFKTSSSASFMQLINYGTRAASPCFYMEMSGTFFTGQIIDDGSNALSLNSGSFAYADGNWHQVIVTVARAGNYKLIVDNSTLINASAAALTGSMHNSVDSGIGLGADEFGANKYDGSLDEVGLWNRALTSGECTAIWNGGAGVTYPF